MATSTHSPEPVQRSEETSSAGTSSTPSSGSNARFSAPGVSREYLRGASYDAAASSLAPAGDASLKYERSLAPGGPVQMDPDPAATDTSKKTALEKLTDGAEKYDVAGKGHYGYTKDEKTGKMVRDPAAAKYGYVKGVGVGGGNRKDDLEQWVDEKDHSKGKERAAAKVSLSDITGIPEPDLKNIKSIAKEEVTGAYGSYAGYDVAAGSASETKNEFGIGLAGKTDTGKLAKDPSKVLDVTAPSGSYQAGGRAGAYAGLKGKGENEYGEVSADVKASADAYGGLSGKYGIDQDGASAEGAIGAGVSVSVTADADVKSKGLKVEGVSDPLTVGAGVHGEASAFAKAGAGGGAYLTKEKVGLWGSMGAGAAAEAKADIHGHVGPVSGTYGVGVLAGAGAGIEGGILYEDGKLVIGGRAYAALGYGVSTGGKIVIDVKQSYELAVAMLNKAKQVGIEGARAAYRAADADADGKLSLNDAATHGSDAMKSGAKSVAGGIDSTISALDGDGDGKFDLRKDMGARASQAGKAISDAGSAAYKAAGEAVDSTIDAGMAAGKQALKAAHNAADVDGDGKLSMKDAGAAYAAAETRVRQTVDAGAKALDYAVGAAHQFGKDRLADAAAAADAAHKFADRSGDGKLGMDDVQQGASELADAGARVKRAAKAVGETYDAAVEGAGKLADAAMERGGQLRDAAVKRGGELVDSAGKAIDSAGKAVHKTLDRSGDGKLGLDDARAGAQQAAQQVSEAADATRQAISDGYAAAEKRVSSAAKAAYDAADLNKDGTVDSKDAQIAAQRARAAAARAQQAAQARLAQMRAAASKAIDDTHAAAKQAVKTAHGALDRSGDGKLGMDDVRAGASQAAARARATGAAVAERATAAYKSASESVAKAGSTIREGWNSASETVGGAVGRAKEFFQPPW